MEPEGVDLAAVAAWMDERGIATGPVGAARKLTGGTQNILVCFEKGGRDWVLRRGPRHLRARSNDVILREARVLGALAGTDVPHPELLAVCEDPAVLGGAVFYLMAPVEGVNATRELSPLQQAEPAVRFEMGLHAADALATLGQVDHEAVGLADFGHPEGFLERQVERWLAELRSYESVPGYVGPDRAMIDRLASWLASNQPASFEPGIFHGDYHLGNVLFDNDGPGVAAIVDWEMSTIGDPLLDLGALVGTWPLPDGTGSILPGPLLAGGGLPTPAQLVERYGERSGRDLSAVAWYTALACFRLGIVLEGTNARAAVGKASRRIGDALHVAAGILFDRATAPGC